jgi:hypothetical protein
MYIDQRHVTTISLQDGRARDVALVEDERGPELRLFSKDDVVHIRLSARDLQKLRQVLLTTNVHSRNTVCVGAPESYPFHWDATDWLAFN